MKESLSPPNEVELTTSSPLETEIQEHKPPMEQMQNSDLGGQIIPMIQRESFSRPERQISEAVEILTDDHTDEKRRPTDTLIQSEKKLDSSLSVRELSPSVRIDEPTGSFALSGDSQMPPLIEEKAAGLQAFLSSLGITFEDLQRLDIPEEPLRQLFEQETTCYSAFKWGRFEGIIDNALQGLLLSRNDLQLGNKKNYLSPRIRPHEHSILLQHRSSLRKAYAANKLVDGIRLGVLGFVRGFITIMLLYRLGSWASSGQRDFSAFEAIFSGNNQKGIDSLTGLLAGLDPSILRFILTSPLILGAAQSLFEFATARQDSEKKVIQRIEVLATYLLKSPGWKRDVLLESIPIFSRLISVSEQTQQLTQSLNWNGKLTLESRLNAFVMIRQIAQRGRKIPQWTAMESLARLAWGIGFKDFPLLQAAGYEQALLKQLLYIKAHAFADLVSLSQKAPEESAIRTVPRRLFASYLLWWLGQSTSWWLQRLPFFSFKASVLMLEVYLFYNIIGSLEKAINCPDKPGFQLGDGYLPWASDYSSTCFARRISLFIQYDYLQTTQQLVAEIPRYHLADFVHLDLQDRYITENDTQSIIQAIVAQDASLKYLYIGMNAFYDLPLDFFADLPQLQYLILSWTQLASLSPGIFNGLSQLQCLDISGNFISNLPLRIFNGLSQLQTLILSHNPLNRITPGVFTDLIQLEVLDLSSLQIANLSSSVFMGLNQLQSLTLYGNPLNSLQPGVFTDLSRLEYLDLSWAQLKNLSAGALNGLSQLQSLNLAGNFLTDLPAGLFTDLSQLQFLDLCGNLLNTSAFIAILSSLPPTLISLNVSQNVITNLPNHIMNLWPPALRILVVGGNPFIPATLTSVWMNNFPIQLTDFSVSASHRIVDISTEAFAGFGQLRSLNLSYNLLSNWSSSTLSGLSQLQDLDLSGNLFITFPPASFASLPQLQSLILTGSPISNLSADVFSGLSQLQQLDLSGTSLSSLPDNVFMSLTQLQSLTITNNVWLFNLPSGLFSNLSQLQYLDLSFNNLTSFPAELYTPLNQLQLLNFSSNLISNVPSGVLTGLVQLKILDISFNEWSSNSLNNISVNFPYQINQIISSVSTRNGTYLDKNVNNWGINIIPCLTQLDSLWVKGDFEDYVFKVGLSYFINLENTLLQQLLRNACEEQLCHANLPPQQLCHPETISSSQIVTPAAYSDRSPMFAQNRQRKTAWQSTQFASPRLESSADFYFPNSSLTPTLSSDVTTLGDQSADDSTNSLAAPVAISAAILGLILLYKNSTWIKAIVDTGCQFLQRCCKKAKPTSTIQRQFSPASTSPHYTVFTSSSSSVKKVSTPTVSPEVIRGKSISNHSSS